MVILWAKHEEVVHMSFISNVSSRISRLSTKHLVVGVVYALLLAGSIGLGLSTQAKGSAAVIRDCGGSKHNSIDNKDMNGGCGAADANEYVADLNANVALNNSGGTVKDLQGISKHFGLDPSEYARFKSTAKPGMAYTNGRVMVDNQLVAQNAWSIGRQGFSYSSSYPINKDGATTYFKSMHTNVLKQDLPVMVMFNDQGTAEFIVINACGNPVGGEMIKSGVTCETLVDSVDAQNPNKHTFTTKAAVVGNAKISRVVYTFSDDNTTVEKKGADALTQKVEHIFKKSGDVTVTVYATVPGGKEIKAAVVAGCKKHIDFKTQAFACTLLTATMPDPKNKNKFRFTVTTSQDASVTVKNADFTLDNSVVTTGVTTKDGQGKLYKEYTFNDEKEHTVKVTVFFNTWNGVKSATSDKCVAKATPEKIPPCTKNPELPECKPPKECKPGIPENDERCNPPEECKPGVPKGSEECNPPVLVVTGPGNIAGLFAGTSILGTAAHVLYTKRRNARKSTEA